MMWKQRDETKERTHARERRGDGRRKERKEGRGLKMGIDCIHQLWKGRRGHRDGSKVGCSLGEKWAIATIGWFKVVFFFKKILRCCTGERRECRALPGGHVLPLPTLTSGRCATSSFPTGSPRHLMG